ncbi:MAG TPA: hypothetical protein VFP37_08585 [Steroidobacteraceae bacterium]|nr:hypothetical protein [Steroidobacteraceae bacterium]
MRTSPFRALPGYVVAIACAASVASEPRTLISLNDPALAWRTYLSGRSTCVLSGTAVSELRDDAFEVRFQQSLHEPLKLFVLIPRLPAGGTVFMEAPTTRDRWRISTNNYSPALVGSRAESLRRNVAVGIPLVFTFEYGSKRRVSYETAPAHAITAMSGFNACIDVQLERLKTEGK